MVIDTKKGLSKEEALSYLFQKELVKREFLDFLDYVFINEPPNRLEGKPGGKVKMEKWDYILEIADALMTEKKVAILKARQIGFSWIVSAYACWLFAFYPGSYIICLSRGEPEAQSLMRKIRFIYANLPEYWMLAPFTTDGRQELSIPFEDGLFSRVVAFASTQDAARGETANLVIQDEAEFHGYIDDNFSAIEPTFNAGGQVIMGSTVNKRKAVSLFKSLYKQAPDNGWKKFFYGWKVKPGRDEQWYKDTKNAVPDSELDGLTPEQFMEQEYPGTEQEALAPSKVSSYFDPEALDYLQQFISEPIHEVKAHDEDYRNIRNIYISRTPRGRYVAGTDVGHGIGGDYSVTVVLDLSSGHIVADIMSSHIRPAEWSEESLGLLKFYRNPWWAIEQNGPGISCIDFAKEKNYPKLFYTDTSTRRGAKPSLLKEAGWLTTPRSRRKMWSEVRDEIDAKKIFVHNRAGMMQFFDVMRMEDGEPDHRQGAHDDYPTAVAIAFAIRAKVSRYATRTDDSAPIPIASYSSRY